uniref:DUF2336 domain-containing protein n=1 Tax=Caenorhabditis tropicalis TaxID=1561998 RepID=A0A1I7UEU3_9PELO
MESGYQNDIKNQATQAILLASLQRNEATSRLTNEQLEDALRSTVNMADQMIRTTVYRLLQSEIPDEIDALKIRAKRLVELDDNVSALVRLHSASDTLPEKPRIEEILTEIDLIGREELIAILGMADRGGTESDGSEYAYDGDALPVVRHRPDPARINHINLVRFGNHSQRRQLAIAAILSVHIENTALANIRLPRGVRKAAGNPKCFYGTRIMIRSLKTIEAISNPLTRRTVAAIRNLSMDNLEESKREACGNVLYGGIRGSEYAKIIEQIKLKSQSEIEDFVKSFGQQVESACGSYNGEPFAEYFNDN